MQEVKVKVVTAGDHCFMRMLTTDTGGAVAAAGVEKKTKAQCAWANTLHQFLDAHNNAETQQCKHSNLMLSKRLHTSAPLCREIPEMQASFLRNVPCLLMGHP